MVGNLINNTVLTPGQTGQAGAFVLLVLVVVPGPDAARTSQRRGPRGWRRDAALRALVVPTRGGRPRVLQAVTAATWSGRCCPVLIAVMFSFNAGRSRDPVAGLLVPLVLGRPDPRRSGTTTRLHTALTHTLLLGVLATAITVPLGVAFALGVDRWRGRLPEGANFVMLLSFVIPETLLAVALLFLVNAAVAPR